MSIHCFIIDLDRCSSWAFRVSPQEWNNIFSSPSKYQAELIKGSSTRFKKTEACSKTMRKRKNYNMRD